MDSFADYLYFLLPSPLKTIGKKTNQWRKLCEVLGRHCDGLKKTILDVREMSMLLTCPPDLLPVFGQERGMPRLKDEDAEQYRWRLMMKNIIAERAGTADGILALLRSLGYDNVYLEPAYPEDASRWAEATAWISGGNLVIDDREIIQEEINSVKPASALVTLAHERIQGGAVYLGVFMETSKIVDMSEV